MRALVLGFVVLVGCQSGSPSDGGGPRDAGTDTPRTFAAPLSCSPATGAPTELLPLLRLAATGTTETFGVWPIENLDGPMTLRDDDPANGWRLERRRLARLELDLGPAVERPVALDTLALDVVGTPPDHAAVLVLESCGGDVVRAFEDVDLGAPIALDGTCGTCVVLELFSDAPDTRVTSLSLTSRDVDLPAPASLGPRPPTPPVPAFPRSGVVEGYYGPPWAFAERARMIETLSALGLGLYLYAPKNDPLHRSRWREPYDAAFVTAFAALCEEGEARGVRVIFGVSPFLDWHATEADYAALEEKLRVFLDAGADGVAILADDIDFGAPIAVDGALGARHVEATNRVLSDLRAAYPAADVLFVPTVYNDEQLDLRSTAPSYLEALTALDPSVEVMWTGTGTASATLGPADLDRVRGLSGRAPLLWDNAWANDAGGGFFGRILLAGYDGRDAALPDAILGVVANPMMQGSLSRLAVGHLGAWLESGAVGDAARVRSAAVEARIGVGTATETERAALLTFLAETFDGDFLRPPLHARGIAALERVVASLAVPEVPAPADLGEALDVLGEIAALRSRVHHADLAPELVDELDGPLANASATAWETLAALELARGLVGGEDTTAARARLTDATNERRAASRFVWAEMPVAAAVETLLGLAPSSLSLAAPVAGTAPPDCVAGRALELMPFASPVAVHGLSGATAAPDGTVRWTPPHPGRFVAVVTATTPSGWASARFELVCRPPR